MSSFQTFLIYLVITVLMAPLLVVYGLPFIAVAKVFNHFAPLWFSDKARFVLSCGIAALGIAPAYDIYRAPLPIYVHLCQGESISAGYMLASWLVTWLVVMAQTHQLSHVLSRRQAA